MLQRILDQRQEDLLRQERQALRALQATLSACEASQEDRATLEQSLRQLDELFLLVVVGEFNAGKSTFINALLGKAVLPEGVTPTTTRIHRLTYGDDGSTSGGESDVDEIRAPVEVLRQVHIVDTPGTNALDRRHEAITEDFVPRADLVLFVTSADRPFTESERAFMERIRQWGKKLVLVVNKIDFLRSESEIQEVLDFVAQSAERMLGFTPEIFAVSAQAALQAKLEPGTGTDLPPESGFAALESFLLETLDERQRVRLKLLSPLGVGLRFADSYGQATCERIDLLQEDFAVLDQVERQLELYREDRSREFRFRLTDVDNLLHEFERRGIDFFDETLRLPRALDLLNKAKLQADFERVVIDDAPQQIEAKVNEIIDWMVATELRQWQGVAKSLDERRTRHSERLIGELGSFDYDRQQLLETVGRAARRTVDRYDRQVESSRLAQSVQTAVAGAAILEVSALGLGAIITAMATTQLADITGLLAAGTLAVLGLFVLPARRRKAKAELSRKILELRERLMTSLQEQFDHETERSLLRIREAIAPYTRFVGSERQRLEDLQRQLAASKTTLLQLQAAVEQL
jgi:small GTP-binding protein